MTYHVYIDYKPDGVPFYVGIGNSARVKNVQRNHWHRAIRMRYPNWTRTVVETAPRKLCMELEELLIAEIGRRDLGTGTLVNFTSGGEGAPTTVIGADTRRKMSEAATGKTKSEEWRKKIAIAHIGMRYSDETRAKVSAAHRGRKQSDAQIRKTSEISKARWQDPEYAAKVSKGIAEAWQDPTYRKAMSDKRKAYMSVPENREAVRRKISEVYANSEELRLAASLRCLGTKWFNKDGTSVRVKPEDVAQYEADGWKRGRK